MPPRVRNKVTKTLKENIGTENRLKTTRSTSNRSRKVLGDKTNSASDDNTSEIREIKKPVVKRSNVIQTKLENNERPRRHRRLPTRFVENPVLKNLSNSKDTSDGMLINDKATPNKNNASVASINTVSPFKTPGKAETSLVVQRPKRICRLPSRLSDAVSPNKYLPIQPANASTPIQNKPKTQLPIKASEKSQNIVKPASSEPKRSKANDKKSSKATLRSNVSSDTNNNARTRSQRTNKQVNISKVGLKQFDKKADTLILEKPKDKHVEVLKFTSKKASPKKTVVSKTKNIDTSSSSNKTSSFNSSNNYLVSSLSPKKASPKKAALKKPSLNVKAKNLSFKVLGGNKNSQEQENSGIDVYEFTFDPNEEPPPQKKKRKRNVTKKPPKPKKIFLKSSYDINISKALNSLKNVVKKTKSTNLTTVQKIESTKPQEEHGVVTTTNVNQINTTQNITKENTNTSNNNAANYQSIRIEDIAADIEPSITEDHHDDINYSPVNSPVPEPTQKQTQNVEKSTRKPNDPLNLLDELSFFDEVPVASSSINTSVRHPLASPWRVEFGSLPIKWHVNTYVKANMTPAVESSYISAEDSSRKKHVYTNLVPHETEPLPEIVNTPNYKQTSIISFIRERAEKSARKKRGRSMSPTKANSLFEDITNIDNNKQQTSIQPAIANNSDSTNNTSNEKQNSHEERKTRKRKNDDNVCELPAKSPRKQKDKDCTFFGFDDSENVENMSPVQENAKTRILRHKSRAVLQEINGPSRAVLPVAAKSKVTTSSEEVNKVYEELKSATDAPVFVENDVNNTTNVEDMTMNEDSQSVHLFEDIDVVHHLKPTRKSYGKPKKVTFQQHSSDSDSHDALPVLNDSSDDDDGADLTFEVPNVKEKKKPKKRKPKKLMSKKEEKEAEEWAAGFNSMCEDIEEFPLLIE